MYSLLAQLTTQIHSTLRSMIKEEFKDLTVHLIMPKYTISTN